MAQQTVTDDAHSLDSQLKMLGAFGMMDWLHDEPSNKHCKRPWVVASYPAAWLPYPPVLPCEPPLTLLLPAAVCAAQLGFHAKPIGLLNSQSYFDPLLSFFQHCIEQVKPVKRCLMGTSCSLGGWEYKPWCIHWLASRLTNQLLPLARGQLQLVLPTCSSARSACSSHHASRQQQRCSFTGSTFALICWTSVALASSPW